MSKQDDQFLPEQVDEQIETLAHLKNSSALPGALLVSNLDQIYNEEHEIAARVWVRLNRHIAQDSSRQKHAEDQAPYILMKEMQPMKTNITQLPPVKNRRHILETVVAVLVIVAVVGSMALFFHLGQTSQSSLASPGPLTPTTQTSNGTSTTATTAPAAAAAAATLPVAPTSVTLRVSAAGISPTSKGNITIPAGTKVTLTVVPDHSLLPFQTFTTGIYAGDPYGFSELENCTYPKTDSCSYTVAYSASEKTDYTKGTHMFKAFLGNIGGTILENSPGITITWS